VSGGKGTTNSKTTKSTSIFRIYRMNMVLRLRYRLTINIAALEKLPICHGVSNTEK